MFRILAAVDGSPSANDAVAYLAHHMPAIREVEVHVLHVQPPIEADVAEIAKPGLLQRLRSDEAQKATAAAEDVLKHAGIRHTVVVETGEPAETIASYAKLHQCNQIVMGTRGLGRIRAIVLGSVANKVIHASDVPVMLVKHAAREDAKAAA